MTSSRTNAAGRTFNTDLQRHRAAQAYRNEKKASKSELAVAPRQGAPETDMFAGFAPSRRMASQAPVLMQAGVSATILAAMCLGAGPQLVAGARPAFAPAPAPIPVDGIGSECISLSGGACPSSFFNGGSAAWAQGLTADGHQETLIVASTAPNVCSDLANSYGRGSSNLMKIRLRNNNSSAPAAGNYTVNLPTLTSNFTATDQSSGPAAQVETTQYDGACNPTTTRPIIPAGANDGTVVATPVGDVVLQVAVNITHNPLPVDTTPAGNLAGSFYAAHCQALGSILASESFVPSQAGWKDNSTAPACII